MSKTIVKVPRGVRYIEEWKEFYNIFPRFPHIMNKKIPGCGFTEWAITNKDNVILCSPRIILLENKEAQHKGEVYRVVNRGNDKDLGVDKDLTRVIAKDILVDERIEEPNFICRLTTELSDYFFKQNLRKAPYKILVTYDSFRILKDILIKMGIFNTFQVVVDEFQSIFTDSRFKSTTEMEFVNVLQDVQKVCYVSATPMIDTYLQELNEFRNLPYYELDWESLDPARVIVPNLSIHHTKSIITSAKKIIEKYKEGNFDEAYVKDSNGQIKKIINKECVIYVNSVNNITAIINGSKLSHDEVNILISNTENNKKKIRTRLGKNYTIGKVPLRDEPRKMFTFCTRTVYLGADFYSDNAKSYILSDANIDCLAVDISLDLPQILGRQRLRSNPWCNSADFYYKSLSENKKNLTKEDFDKRIAEKMQETLNKLANYDSAVNKQTQVKDYEKIVNYENYRDDYIAVNKHLVANKIPVLNNLVLVAERRAFDIQQIDYKDRFSVFNTIDKTLGTGGNSILKEIEKFFDYYNTLTNAREKLKFLCEAQLSEQARQRVEGSVDEKIKSFLSLGKDRCKALGYNTFDLMQELKSHEILSESQMLSIIFGLIEVGKRYSLKDIKETLAKAYKNFGYNKVAKASDLEQWFKIKKVLLTSSEGKRIHGFEILAKK